MTMDAAAMIMERFSGAFLTAFDRLEGYGWTLTFTNGIAVTSQGSKWRIVKNTGIVVSSEDDGHLFGLPQPFDSERSARELLVSRPIRNVSVQPASGDLVIDFGDAAIEFLTDSMGYEGWHFTAPGLEVILTGGGRLSVSTDGKNFT